LERHWVFLACSLALLKTGNRIAARIAIIAITTSSSISVKPRFFIYESPPRKIIKDGSMLFFKSFTLEF
jgi:hypothetical protein